MRGFPEGCDKCDSTIEWDCYHKNDDGSVYLCPWRENHWKYKEVQETMRLWKLKNGGLDLNRIKSLEIDDFLKISILSEFIEGIK